MVGGRSSVAVGKNSRQRTRTLQLSQQLYSYVRLLILSPSAPPPFSLPEVSCTLQRLSHGFCMKRTLPIPHMVRSA